MTKTLAAALLAALALLACAAPETPASADEDWLYGRHAGQPMRDAPDGAM